MATTDKSGTEPQSGAGSPLGLTGFQTDLLITIARYEQGQESDDPPPYGLGIKSALEAKYSSEINHGRLYPNLDTLVSMGLLAKGTLDKRTNTYRITQRGRRELSAYLKWIRPLLANDREGLGIESD